ncbi:MAG: hypothetical protein AAF645_21580, partial [Myxococcota bacterium]
MKRHLLIGLILVAGIGTGCSLADESLLDPLRDAGTAEAEVTVETGADEGVVGDPRVLDVCRP